MITLPTDLPSFILWLGTSAGIGVALSVIAELVPGWADLSAGAKNFIITLVSIVLPVLSQVLLQVVPASVFNAANGWYLVVLAILAAAGVINTAAAGFHAFRRRNGLLPSSNKA